MHTSPLIECDAKALVMFGLAVLVLSFAILATCYKKTVGLDIGNTRVSLRLVNWLVPLSGNRSRLIALHKEGSLKKTEILHQICERPVLVIPDGIRERVMCLYDYDVEVKAFVVEVAHRESSSITVPDALKSIVLSSAFPVHEATIDDLAFMKDWISNINNHTLREYSIPSLDCGFCRCFIHRSMLLAMIDRIPKSE
jgi:hypothetical protein